MNINPRGFVDKPSVDKTNKFILQFIGPLHYRVITINQITICFVN